MGIQMSLSGLQDINNTLTAWLEEKTAKTNDAIQGAGIDTEAAAKQACPVDTGRLRASIAYESTGDSSCQVGTDVEYAPFVELGTSKQAAQPYLFPAFVQASANLEQEIQDIFS